MALMIPGPSLRQNLENGGKISTGNFQGDYECFPMSKQMKKKCYSSAPFFFIYFLFLHEGGDGALHEENTKFFFL